MSKEKTNEGYFGSINIRKIAETIKRKGGKITWIEIGVGENLERNPKRTGRVGQREESSIVIPAVEHSMLATFEPQS